LIQKCDALVCDKTGHAVALTLWDNLATIKLHIGDIIALKSVKVGTFRNTLNLTTSFNTRLYLNEERIGQCVELQ
jgi:hypothetical protein